MRNPAGASSWTHEAVTSVLSLCAHVGAFRGPLGKLGVMGGVWGFFPACLSYPLDLHDTLRLLTRSMIYNVQRRAQKIFSLTRAGHGA